MAALKYCSDCGGPLLRHVIAGELRGHWFCQRCNSSRYDHPMIVVTTFVACAQKLLWVQRNLEPQRGKWAIPGGFLENGETLAAGAARELYEEAGVSLAPESLQLYMTGAITFTNQIYVGFRAEVDVEDCLAGVESMACAFFARDECPWDEVAYPQVNNSILQAYDDLESGCYEVWQAEMTANHYALKAVLQSSGVTDLK